MSQTIYAAFSDVKSAEQAAGALLDHGIRSEDLSLVSKDDEGKDRRDYVAHSANKDELETDENRALESGNEDPNSRTGTELNAKHGISTTTPQDAAAGAAKGAGIGLGVGAVAAIASLFIPGVGIVTGMGALALALSGTAGATAAGALAGGVEGYLKDQGIPAEAATHYSQTYQSGGSILAVQRTSDNIDLATIEGVLHKYNATSINSY